MLNQTVSSIKKLKMVKVKESFPFTEATLKLSPIEELSIIDCILKVEDSFSFDPLN
jgi:hypothetical protein